MVKQTRSALVDYIGKTKEKLRLTLEIQESEKTNLTFYMRFRYVGLGLVQGS